MKTKYILVFIIVGFLLAIIGSLFKIQHWSYGFELYITGTLFKLVFGLALIYKILTFKKFQDFLNS
ncbi:MAG: gliding motility protein GldL [Winogradskyella sp.]|jgi:hypothetical protein|nr:gliding motility protein GldL [Winogradskyella sp.]